MGVRVLEDKYSGYKCLYCSTTMVAFGDIFYKNENVDDFLEWLPKDARAYTQLELSSLINDWRDNKEVKKVKLEIMK